MQTPHTEPGNRRDHARVQFFRLRIDEGFVPVFAFAPADDPDVFAALIMDCSESGLQIVCSADEFVEAPLYQCILVDTTCKPTHRSVPGRSARSGRARRACTARSGSRWTPRERTMSDAVEQIERADHHLLRCLLHPLRQID